MKHEMKVHPSLSRPSTAPGSQGHPNSLITGSLANLRVDLPVLPRDVAPPPISPWQRHPRPTAQCVLARLRPLHSRQTEQQQSRPFHQNLRHRTRPKSPRRTTPLHHCLLSRQFPAYPLHLLPHCLARTDPRSPQRYCPQRALSCLLVARSSLQRAPLHLHLSQMHLQSDPQPLHLHQQHCRIALRPPW